MKIKKGFTLVELLVVIAIIGLLATIAFISLNTARAKARDAKKVSDVRQVMAALELYYGDNSGYPTDGTAGLGYVAWAGIGTPLTNYIGSMPLSQTALDGSCTTANTAYTYQSEDAAGATCDTAPCAAYKIRFCIGAATGSMSAGQHIATPNGIQ